MSETYQLDESLYRIMLEQCREKAPAEACGLLGGPGPDKGTRIFPLENLDNCAESYRMSPQDILSTMRQLDEDDMELNAIYHSHPATQAYPSGVDTAKAYMDVVYLILSLRDTDPVLRGFRINEGEIREVTVTLTTRDGEVNVNE